MRRRAATVGIVVALLAAACGEGPARPVVVEGGSGSATLAGEVRCGDATYDPAAFADAPPAASLPDEPLTALVEDGAEPAFDPSQDWRVVHESATRVDVVRELDEPLDAGQGDVRTHEVRTVEVTSGAPDVPDGTWTVTLAGPCAQRLVASSDTAAADLALPEAPDPAATTLSLLVHERACASGRSADGRIEVLELEETDAEIRLKIGVQRLPGEQECPGNPPTPFEVELQQPVGGRAILDGAVEPPREIALGPVSATPSEPGAAGPSCEQIETFARRLVDVGFAYDYEPSDGPVELAEWVDVVLRGHLTGEVVHQPATRATEASPGDPHVGYVIAVEEVLAGESAVTGETATVAMAYAPSHADAADYADAVVEGIPVLVFAYESTEIPGGLIASVMEGFLTACGDGPLLGWVADRGTWQEVGSLDAVAELVRTGR